MILTDWLFEIFDSLTPEQILLVIFFLFMVDALMIPTLPEMFIILGFHNSPTLLFGSELLIAAVVGELVGVFSLYYVVRHIKVPKRVAGLISKYIDFLIVSDEKILLINRIAPMLPAMGAFIAIMGRKWDMGKCLLYLISGCILKYGAILIASDIAYEFIGGKMAQDIVIVFIIVILVLSFISSFLKKKKNNLE